jgi:hypothetical protein
VASRLFPMWLACRRPWTDPYGSGPTRELPDIVSGTTRCRHRSRVRGVRQFVPPHPKSPFGGPFGLLGGDALRKWQISNILNRPYFPPLLYSHIYSLHPCLNPSMHFFFVASCFFFQHVKLSGRGEAGGKDHWV